MTFSDRPVIFWLLDLIVLMMWARNLSRRRVPLRYTVPILACVETVFATEGSVSLVLFVAVCAAYIFIILKNWDDEDKGGDKKSGFRERLTEVAERAFRREARAAA